MSVESGHSVIASARRWLGLIALALLAACGQQDTSESPAPPTGEWIAFEGNGTLTGTHRVLPFGPEHRITTFDLTGSLLLTGKQRPSIGFQAHAIGYADSRQGVRGGSVWTDERGEQLFSELHGESLAPGNRIVGTFVGGTGRYAGVAGEYAFEWQYLIASDENDVSGRIVGLKGRVRLVPPGAGSGGSIK